MIDMTVRYVSRTRFLPLVVCVGDTTGERSELYRGEFRRTPEEALAAAIAAVKRLGVAQ